MGDAPTARLEAHVSGRVQGVGFREWVRKRATALGLAGSAHNLSDGRVEVVVQGTRPACADLLAALRADVTPGRVRSVTETWSAPVEDVVGFTTG